MVHAKALSGWDMGNLDPEPKGASKFSIYFILQHACPNPSLASKIKHWKLQQLEEWAKSILKKVKGLSATHIKVLESLLRGYLLVHSSPCLQQQWFWRFLMERNSVSALHGQATVSTLILQDCVVGLLFALLPVLGGTSGILQYQWSTEEKQVFSWVEIYRYVESQL